MNAPHINPHYLFPAPGWKCFQCSILEDGTADFLECSVIGWGVVEGFDCDEEYNPEGTDLQLLVALQDAPMEAPMVYRSSDLDGVLSNAAFGFLHVDGAFDDEYRTILEQKARKKMMRRKVA